MTGTVALNSDDVKAVHDYSKDYLTFEAIQNTTFAFSQNALQYSLDDGATWTTLAANTASPTVTAGNKILWKQTGLAISINNGIGTFSATGNFEVSGNIMSLLFGDNFIGQTDLTGKYYAFYYLFSYNNKIVNAENLILPATILDNYCYKSMFQYCKSLITAFELPATTLKEGCYQSMFEGCTSLTTAPVLPATTLAIRCYANMFKGCTSLKTAPELPVTTLKEGCYQYMFYGCTSLKTGPELPATTLADTCYQYMFYSCTSLKIGPELHATTLDYCCYYSMFYGCTSLNYIKCLATTMSATDCTTNWVNNVAASGTFITVNNPPTWTRDIHGIPANWDVYTESQYEVVRHYELDSISTTPQLKTVNNESLIGTGNIVISGLPAVTSSDNGKILMVVNGQWQLVSPSTLYSGSGAPNNANGNNGDLYMQTD